MSLRIFNETGVYPENEIIEKFLEFDNDSFAEIVDINQLTTMFHFRPGGSNFGDVRRKFECFHWLYEEVFQTASISILTFSRGYLNEILDKFIMECHQHGIIQRFRRYTNRFEEFKLNFDRETQVLSLFMLSAGFYVWLITVAIACIVFIGECAKYQIEKLIFRQYAKIKGLVYFD